MERRGFLFVFATLLAGCVSAPAARSGSSVLDHIAERAAAHATAMVGKPYLYAGNTPAGFDCSGLVQYSYAQSGVNIPRHTRALREASQPVSMDEVRRGDLIFFDERGVKLSHVALYLGGGRFVHAPSSGGRVRIDELQSPYWRERFVEARRVAASR
jgi:cell wall-associated NlpC family hydrolase